MVKTLGEIINSRYTFEQMRQVRDRLKATDRIDSEDRLRREYDTVLSMYSEAIDRLAETQSVVNDLASLTGGRGSWD